MTDHARWLRPEENGVTRREILRQRHLIKRAVRDYLHDNDFVEIDMPLLVRGTTPDLAIDSFTVQDRYLATSTEYQIKRMEAGGFDRLYTLTQNFRAGDTGRYRNPEFTMLEWARVSAKLDDIEADMQAMFLAAHRAIRGMTAFTYGGRTIDIHGPWDRLSVRDAINRYTGTNLRSFAADDLFAVCQAAGIDPREDWRGDVIFLFTVLLDHIQPQLGLDRPVFLQEWPRFLTSSAAEKGEEFAERSELFVAGIELSDGFPSLTSAERQRQSFSEQLALRNSQGKAKVSLDHSYIAMMDGGLPDGAGMAMGFDRLVMLLTDRPKIADVLAFGWDEL